MYGGLFKRGQPERTLRASGECGGKSSLFFLIVLHVGVVVGLAFTSWTCIHFNERQFTPPNEIISRRLRVTASSFLGGARLGVSTRIATHFTCAVRQSTRRSMKIKGRKRGAIRVGPLFVRTDNRIRSSVCARHGQIVVQVG